MANQNLIRNASFEADASNWANAGSGTGTSITRVTTAQEFGVAAGRAATAGDAADQGCSGSTASGLGLAAGVQAIGSVWLCGNSGGEQVDVFASIGNTDSSSTNGTRSTVILTTLFQRFVTAPVTVAVGKTGDQLFLFIRNGSGLSVAQTYLIDGAQLEVGASATPFIDPTGDISLSDPAWQVQQPVVLLTS